VLTVLGIFIAGFSSILTGLNFIVTIHEMRAPGMTWFACRCLSGRTTRRRLSGSRHLSAITLVLVGVERIWHVGFLIPLGDPVFQHLFWFYSHPTVYIMILQEWV
jgi:cytochrome c oxidase subunit 1